MPSRAWIYVDGFNLYRRALKGRPIRWLDLEALFTALLPDHTIDRIKYFTATVKPSPADLHVRRRQEAYLEALRANPRIEIHLGYFRRDNAELPVHPWEFHEDGSPKMVMVKKTQEKGSDVNLATHLIWDALHDEADAYVVVTNDSDLTAPIRMLKDRGTSVGVVFPSDGHSRDLLSTGAAVHRIRRGLLELSQLPNPVRGVEGTPIPAPPGWTTP